MPPCSERTPRIAFVCEVRDCRVGLLPEWNNQSQSILCWIVRAKRQQEVNGKVVTFRVTWTESVLLVPP